jgi:hypothetical protein
MKSFAMLLATALLTMGSLAAQDQKPAPPPAPAQNAHQTPARETYRLDYTITELDEGKKVNTRTYSVMCEDEGGATRGVLKVGSRVPVSSGPMAPGGAISNLTYIDVGMNIDARLTTMTNGELTLQSDVEMSSVADSPVPGQATAPVIRQLKVTTNNALSVGKPVVISSADDVASHRQFQIQVVATKLK